jgi:hypothetical protein
MALLQAASARGCTYLSRWHARRGVSEPRVGDTVVAQDGTLGEVESVIRTETRAPAYVVVAVRRFGGRRYPVVPWSLVVAVDRSGHRVQVRGRRKTVSRLSETVPLVV